MRAADASHVEASGPGRPPISTRRWAYESWVDRQIREAEERGEFDNLPGAGKPLKNLDKPQDDDWWIKGLMDREQLSFVLPTSLALRKEVEDLPKALEPLWREHDVRELVEDLNERIVEARRRPASGPPVFVKTVDVDEAVAHGGTHVLDRGGRRRAPPPRSPRRPTRRRRGAGAGSAASAETASLLDPEDLANRRVPLTAGARDGYRFNDPLVARLCPRGMMCACLSTPPDERLLPDAWGIHAHWVNAYDDVVPVAPESVAVLRAAMGTPPEDLDSTAPLVTRRGRDLGLGAVEVECEDGCADESTASSPTTSRSATTTCPRQPVRAG